MSNFLRILWNAPFAQNQVDGDHGVRHLDSDLLRDSIGSYVFKCIELHISGEIQEQRSTSPSLSAIVRLVEPKEKVRAPSHRDGEVWPAMGVSMAMGVPQKRWMVLLGKIPSKWMMNRGTPHL